MISQKDACYIIQLANDAGVKLFVEGGWGVDALLGYERRAHNDIDLFVDDKDYIKFINIIKNKGFREVNMEYTTPNHTVWQDDNNRIIDLHRFYYGDEGMLVFEGESYPAKVFDCEGIIGGIKVNCMEPYSQVIFHTGYEHDDDDAHDVKLLCNKFNIELPPEYK